MRKLLELARQIGPGNGSSRLKIVTLRTPRMLGGRVVRKCVVEAA